MGVKVEIAKGYEYMRGYLEQLPDMPRELPHGKTLRNGRNRVTLLEEKDIVVKEFIKMTVANRLLYSTLRKSKARRSFENARQLLDLGVGTPPPVAYIEEKKGGILQRSFYVYKYCEWPSAASFFATDFTVSNLRATNECIEFIVQLHTKGIIDNDLNPTNILYQETQEGFQFKLIDLNRILFFHKLKKGVRMRNLTRMTGDPQIYLYMIAKYAELTQAAPYKTLLEGVAIKLHHDHFTKTRRVLKQLLFLGHGRNKNRRMRA